MMKIASVITFFMLGVSLFLPLFSEVSDSAPPELYTTYIYSDKAVFISEFTPSSNFNMGSSRYYLDVGENEATYKFVSFVWFDISDIPEDADIQEARLGLYLNADPQNIPVRMYRIRETWDEDMVTWSSKPSYKDFSKTEGLIDSLTITDTGRNYWDATIAVEEWFDGSRDNYGVAFESSGYYYHRFASDENTYHEPVLAVDYYSGSGGGSEDPPVEPPEDSEPCEISYVISPEDPSTGDLVTITATATDNVGLSYITIREGSITRCVEYGSGNSTTSLTCTYSEMMTAPGKTFVIEADDIGSALPQAVTVPVTVSGSGSTVVTVEIEFRDQHAIPSFYRLLPGDNQTVNVTATATDPDGIRHMTITINGDLYDFLIDPPETLVSRTVSVINNDVSMDTFRYSAAATDVEGVYTSAVGEDIEIRTPFQWFWGLNFSNWGVDKNHSWDWEIMESIFGDSEIYMDKDRGWKYDWAWRLYDAKVRRGGRKGQCFGMCTTALELGRSPARITANEIQTNASGVDDLLKKAWNTTWRYYFARQCGQYSDAVAPRRVAQYLDLYFTDWAASGWTGMHPYLEDLLDTIAADLEAGEFGILSIREDRSGHAVVPWRIVPGDTEEAVTRMYIYDPNHAHVSYHHETDYSVFNHYRFIECNVNTRFADWWLYQWNTTSLWQDEIMYFTYEEAIGDLSEINYLNSVDITDHDIPPGIAYLVAIGSGDATYYAEDSTGRQTGFVDGVLKSEIPHAAPLIDLQTDTTESNIMLYLPTDVDLTFHLDTDEVGSYTFSLKIDEHTYSIINKTIISENDESISFSPQTNSDEYVIGLDGFGDDEYEIICTSKYQDSNEEMVGREYILIKESDNPLETIEFAISPDNEQLIVRNEADEMLNYSVVFRSTESLADLDYIPLSEGKLRIAPNQILSVSPQNWQTTEIQATIIQAEVTDQQETPGFELLIFCICICIVLFLSRRFQKT